MSANISNNNHRYLGILVILLGASNSIPELSLGVTTVTAFTIPTTPATTTSTLNNKYTPSTIMKLQGSRDESIRNTLTQYRRHSSPSTLVAPSLLKMSARSTPETDSTKTDNKNNADEASNTLSKELSLGDKIIASFPEFSFWDIAQDKKKSLGDKIVASFPEFSFWDVAQGDEARLRKRDLIRSLLRRLANLSLQDYYWRSDYFKKTEADRRVEESMARMMGEDASYFRPMDASDEKIGPLGNAEKTLVKWLSLVFEEEGKRARLISSSNGDLIRPMDLQTSGDGGPLAKLENNAVTLLNDIRDSEKERAKTMTLRPKDLNEEKRGPLGDLEYRVVRALDEIRESEKLRLNQSRQRGGEVVRPIDVPGPLGELERWYLELITAEKQRSKDREKNDGKLVRPKDGTLQGPMGDAERQFSETVQVIKEEERERLRNIQRVLEENRPMDKDRNSAIGVLEAFLVGVFRAPQLLFRVVDRVNELLQSSPLNENDKQTLKKKQ